MSTDDTGHEVHPDLRRARRGGVRMVTNLLDRDDPNLVSQCLDALQEMMDLTEYDESFAGMDGYNLLLKLSNSSNSQIKSKAITFLSQIPSPGKLDVDITIVDELMESLVKEPNLETRSKIISALTRVCVYEDWSGGYIVRPECLSKIFERLKTAPKKDYHLIHILGSFSEYDEVRLLSPSDSEVIVISFMELSADQQQHFIKPLSQLYQNIDNFPISRAMSIIINFLSSESSEVRENTTQFLENICGSKSSHEIRSMVIGPLLEFLGSEKPNLVMVALSLLRKLSELSEVTEEIVVKGGVKRILGVLNSKNIDNEEEKNIAKSLLKRIVEEPENKIRVVEAGDLADLLNSLPKDIADEILAALSFKSFVERGLLPLDIAQLLLDNGVDPSADDNATIVHACTHGMTDIVALLLKDPRVDPSVGFDIALRNAASKGQREIIEMLLADERVNPSASGNAAIISACENGHYEVFALFYADNRVDVQFSYLFEAAIRGGNIQIVEELLKIPNIVTEISSCSTDFLALAIQWHHRKIVEILLDSDTIRPVIDPSRHDNHAIQWASRNGFSEIVDLLLCDARVDPCAGDNAALRQAVLNNHVDTVDVLLKDHRPDPSFEENFLIRNACARGYNEITRLLLDDPRVDPSAQENAAIRIAARKGHVESIEELLAHDLVDPSDVKNEAVINAASEGHINIVRMLCRHPGVDPSAQYNKALKVASEKGWVEVVEILLHDKRVDPSVGNLEIVKRALEADNIHDKETLWKNFVSQFAQKHNHPKIATLIETDPRASPAFLWNYAIHNKNVDFVKLLLNDERIKDVHIKNAFSIASKKGDFDIMELLLQADNCDISLKEVGKSIATGFTMMKKKIESLDNNLDELYEGQVKMQKKLDTLVELMLEKVKVKEDN